MISYSKEGFFVEETQVSIDYELYKQILEDCLQTPFAQDMRYKLMVE
ncbi:MAG: hypothetical protein ACR2F1_04325 [Nitrososphaeraceae archaeon]